LDDAHIQQSWIGLFSGMRAAFPLAVLAACVLHLLLREDSEIRRPTLPEALWLYYGLVCLISSIYTNPWFNYSYWGFAYLSVFSATEVFMNAQQALERAEKLNRLNWLLASVLLLAIILVARGQLLAETRLGLSGYGIHNRIGEVAGMPMIRNSGISRLAAVPAIVAFIFLWHRRGFSQLFWASVFLSSAYLVWVMQSRGSLASFIFALCLMVFLLGGRARLFGILLAVSGVAVLLLGLIPGESVHQIYLYATRGEQGARLASMSGRVSIYHESWSRITEALFIGYGPQADRRLLFPIGNASNGALYALLCGGFLGGLGYVGGLLVGWLMLLRVARRRYWLEPTHRITLLQVAGIMMFFTLRSYPENSAAVFSIDLLLQLSAIVYLGELDRAIRRIEALAQEGPRLSEKSLAPVFEAAQAHD
jgi:hypothetical protein